MMDRLGKALLEDLGLQTALHELRAREPEHEIELALRVQEEAVANHAAKQGFAVEDAVLVLLVLGEQLTGRRTHLRQDVLHAPDLTLVLQAVLPHDFHLRVQTVLLERTLRLTESRGTVAVVLAHFPLRPTMLSVGLCPL